MKRITYTRHETKIIIKVPRIGKNFHKLINSSECRLIVAAFFLTLVVPVSTHAMTVITQSFTTEEDLALGALVSLKNNSKDVITTTSASNINSIFVAAINDGSLFLSLNASIWG